ncbi:MAG: APC family permease [Candidatus Dormibacteraceae bacterium]
MLGVVIMGPSLAMYFAWGFMIPTVGRATAVVFAIALFISLPTAYSYALINSRRPASGATYKWASQVISPQVGIATGLITTIYYALFLPAQLPFIGLVAADLARSTSHLVLALFMAASLLAALPLIYRGITFNIETSTVLVAIEVVIVTAIAVGAFVAATGSHLSLTPLNPGKIPSTSALVPALVLGVLSFTGYDAISTLAGETRVARRFIPRATLLSVVAIAIAWMIWAILLSDAIAPASYVKTISQNGFPLAEAARKAFGSVGRDVIDVMGLEAAFALIIGASIGATRIIHSMGRDGVLTARFGTVHPRFKVPWFALTAVVGLAIVVEVLLSFYVGIGINVLLWLSNLIVFLALATYIVINVCNPLLFWRHFRLEMNWFKNGVVPVVGVIVCGYFMYKGFFEVLLNANFEMGGSTVVAAIALVIVCAIVGLALGRRADVRKAARAHPLDEAEG